MKTNFTKIVPVRYIPVIISFFQAHWLSIVCSAAIVAAGANFGDKSYLSMINAKTQQMIKNGKNKEAIKLIETNIKQYNKWRENNINNNNIKHIDKVAKEMYCYLAIAKEKNGYDKNDIKQTYLMAVGSRQEGRVLSKLYNILSEDEYKSVILKLIKAEKDKSCKKNKPVKLIRLTQISSWPALKVYLDVLFKNVKEPVKYARSITNSIKSKPAMAKKFHQYCKSKPELTEFIMEKMYQKAKEYTDKYQFDNAAIVYSDIIKKCDQKKVDSVSVKIKLAQCYFNAGNYSKTIDVLDDIIKNYKSRKQNFVETAILMKGKTWIQLGQVNKAMESFLDLMVEYPETENAPEANFFIGYCYMLQGKFDLAKEALELMSKKYPSSNFANKAKLCIERINTMNTQVK